MPITDTTMEDHRNLNLIRQGGKMRELGMKSLHEKYAAHFCKFFKYQGLNEADAKDIVQETFTKIFRHCDSYRGDSPLAAWLATRYFGVITLNVIAAWRWSLKYKTKIALKSIMNPIGF